MSLLASLHCAGAAPRHHHLSAAERLFALLTTPLDGVLPYEWPDLEEDAKDADTTDESEPDQEPLRGPTDSSSILTRAADRTGARSSSGSLVDSSSTGPPTPPSLRTFDDLYTAHSAWLAYMRTLAPRHHEHTNHVHTLHALVRPTPTSPHSRSWARPTETRPLQHGDETTVCFSHKSRCSDAFETLQTHNVLDIDTKRIRQHTRETHALHQQLAHFRDDMPARAERIRAHEEEVRNAWTAVVPHVRIYGAPLAPASVETLAWLHRESLVPAYYLACIDMGHALASHFRTLCGVVAVAGACGLLATSVREGMSTCAWWRGGQAAGPFGTGGGMGETATRLFRAHVASDWKEVWSGLLRRWYARVAVSAGTVYALQPYVRRWRVSRANVWSGWLWASVGMWAVGCPFTTCVPVYAMGQSVASLHAIRVALLNSQTSPAERASDDPPPTLTAKTDTARTSRTAPMSTSAAIK